MPGGVDTLWNLCYHYWVRPAALSIKAAGEARKGVAVLRKYSFIRRKRRSLDLSPVSAGSIQVAPANGYPHARWLTQRARRQ